MRALFCKPGVGGPALARPSRAGERAQGRERLSCQTPAGCMGDVGACCRRAPKTLAEPGRAGRKSPRSLVLFLSCARVFAEGSHRVFWNCGEAQVEVSSDSSLGIRTAKGQGWNVGASLQGSFLGGQRRSRDQV